MFTRELADDIPRLRGYVEKKDHRHIRDFAHKYNMRLTFLGHSEALACCNRITEAYDASINDKVIEEGSELVSILSKFENGK
jgi:hypothetical protein